MLEAQLVSPANLVKTTDHNDCVKCLGIEYLSYKRVRIKVDIWGQSENSQVGCIPCTTNNIGKLKKHIVDLIWLE